MPSKKPPKPPYTLRQRWVIGKHAVFLKGAQFLRRRGIPVKGVGYGTEWLTAASARGQRIIFNVKQKKLKLLALRRTRAGLYKLGARRIVSGWTPITRKKWDKLLENEITEWNLAVANVLDAETKKDREEFNKLLPDIIPRLNERVIDVAFKIGMRAANVTDRATIKTLYSIKKELATRANWAMNRKKMIDLRSYELELHTILGKRARVFRGPWKRAIESGLEYAFFITESSLDEIKSKQ